MLKYQGAAYVVGFCCVRQRQAVAIVKTFDLEKSEWIFMRPVKGPSKNYLPAKVPSPAASNGGVRALKRSCSFSLWTILWITLLMSNEASVIQRGLQENIITVPSSDQNQDCLKNLNQVERKNGKPRINWSNLSGPREIKWRGLPNLKCIIGLPLSVQVNINHNYTMHVCWV